MKYKCISSFSVDKYDENGFVTEDTMEVSRDSVWVEDHTSVIGGDVHLENEDTCEWIEVPKDILRECFEKLN